MSITVPSSPNMYVPRKEVTLVFAFSIRLRRHFAIFCSRSIRVGYVVVSLVTVVG